MRRVLLDANLVVLLVVGNANRDRIQHHKRLSAYRAEDWDLLVDVLNDYEQIVVTPNILAEASNLVRSGDKKPKSQADFADVFAKLTFDSDEHYLPSVDAVVDPEFLRLGLSDVASLQTIDADMTILTVDAGLFVAALRRGLPARNFNHDRDAAA